MIIDCDRNGYGCDGGDEIEALQFVRTHGLELESAYPYHARNKKCTSSSSKVFLHPKKSGAYPEISHVTTIKPKDLVSLETAVAVRVVTSAIDAEPLDDYVSGIIANKRDCRASESQIDHAVNIIGYGTDGSQQYWLFRNSWGADWGLDGYFKVIKNMSDHGNGCMAMNLENGYPTIQIA